MLLNLIL